MPAIHIDKHRQIAPVDPRIYSGFTEHMGRCIYGGIYEPDNQHGLADPKTGLRKDVLEALKSLNVPIFRYPGGNFVSSYRWQDGIGPKDKRPRRPELAWLTEESNQFGTDEFMVFCREMNAEPYICLNMGTGTLEDALAWLEYCNSSANTHFANLRRANGHEEPYNVKYWSLGNEVWGPWQVGQMTAEDYAKKAYQWAKALKLLDPSIKLISCGETGHADWDRVALKALAPVVDFHSIHIYTVSQGEHSVNVMGRTCSFSDVQLLLVLTATSSPAAAAEKALDITKSLTDLALIEAGLEKEIPVCFDEWNVWDPVRAPGEKGAEEHYDLSDALGNPAVPMPPPVASWLNVFVRKADIVKIACIAQSVNVISPIITSPTGLYKQTTFYPLHLFATLMHGTSLSVYVDSPIYEGKTVPSFVKDLSGKGGSAGWGELRKWVDVSAVLSGSGDGQEIRVAIVNRHPEESFQVPILFGPETEVAKDGKKVKVYEVYSDELGDQNGFEGEKVKTVEREMEVPEGRFQFEVKKHAFYVLVFPVKA
ncbi:hypothetical protein V5O48_002506 [Marasmius crinis-equi]|uniref:non-reducing end alpha-L-arabinofuranosidase n=1 Tax=Marasmius crinis-equi TaxID=585013 RepID=A0ABR3FVH9_9AGAR